MKKYISLMRLDHWIKQLFIVPGVVCGIYLTKDIVSLSIGSLLLSFLLGLLGTSLIASANYVINEYLDAEFDKFHPIKKKRIAVNNEIKGSIVWVMWFILGVLGLAIGSAINKSFFFTQLLLLIMGILYNVKPIRTKDVAFLDVLSESINNAIRLMLGWFIVTDYYFPPISIVLGYWMAGAFLMAVKRYSEYCMINDPKVAGLYRRSFQHYTDHSLLISAFFYGICSVFLVGIFLIKYRIELILLIPFFVGLHCYYLYLSFKKDSAVQSPEKLYKEHGLLLYLFALVVLFIILMMIDIPVLSIFETNTLVRNTII